MNDQTTTLRGSPATIAREIWESLHNSPPTRAHIEDTLAALVVEGPGAETGSGLAEIVQRLRSLRDRHREVVNNAGGFAVPTCSHCRDVAWSCGHFNVLTATIDDLMMIAAAPPSVSGSEAGSLNDLQLADWLDREAHNYQHGTGTRDLTPEWIAWRDEAAKRFRRAATLVRASGSEAGEPAIMREDRVALREELPPLLPEGEDDVGDRGDLLTEQSTAQELAEWIDGFADAFEGEPNNNAWNLREIMRRLRPASGSEAGDAGLVEWAVQMITTARQHSSVFDSTMIEYESRVDALKGLSNRLRPASGSGAEPVVGESDAAEFADCVWRKYFRDYAPSWGWDPFDAEVIEDVRTTAVREFCRLRPALSAAPPSTPETDDSPTHVSEAARALRARNFQRINDPRAPHADAASDTEEGT